MKTVVITGGSGGIGRAAAQKFAQEGYKVFELSRHGRSDNGITHITADVTDGKALREAFRQIEDLTDSLDLVICNAGFGISGAVEFTELESA